VTHNSRLEHARIITPVRMSVARSPLTNIEKKTNRYSSQKHFPKKSMMRYCFTFYIQHEPKDVPACNKEIAHLESHVAYNFAGAKLCTGLLSR
jgi:hypothetical protein